MMKHSILIGAISLLVAVAPVSVALAQDNTEGSSGAGDKVSSGQLNFNNHCRTCHTTDAGDNRLAPHLNGIVGRKSGSVEGYGYSSALSQLDETWTRENLDKFIEDSDTFAPGNKMQPYGGIKEAEIRKSIIDHLENPK